MASSSPSSPSATTPTRPARAWCRWLPVRFSLWQLFAAVTLLGIGIVGWQAYEYMSIPKKEAAAERKIRECVAAAKPTVTKTPMAAFGYGKLESNWQYEAFNGSSRPEDGLCWRFAGRRPVNGIHLQFTNITLLDSRIFANFNELTHVALTGPVTDDQLVYLFSIPTLRSIRLQDVQLPKEAAIALAKNQQLEELSIIYSTLNDEAAIQFGSLKGLRTLDLQVTDVTDKTIEHVLPQLPRLERLNLTKRTRTSQITDRSCVVIARHPSLKFVHLNNTAITDAGIGELAISNSIQNLGLQGTAITNASLTSFLNMQALVGVSVTATKCTNAGVAEFERKRPNVNVSSSQLQ